MQIADDIIARDIAGLDLDCDVGCHWCCHQLVVLTCRDDGEAILDAARAAFGDARYLRFKQQVREQAAAIGELSYEEAETRQWTCPLLQQDSRCGVYEQRPVACRSVVSEDVDCCRSMVEATEFSQLSRHHQALAEKIGERAMRLQFAINDRRPIHGAFELRELLAELLEARGE